MFLPVSKKYKILIDKMCNCKIEEQFLANDYFSFWRGNNYLHERYVVLHCFENGLIKIYTVSKDG